MIGGKYLAIFGGRNDKMFHVVGNVALNDLHLFDLQALQWVTVALYCQDGAMPLSRWGHSMVTADYSSGLGSGSSMMLFGGVNLKSFCEGSALFEFSLDEKQIAQNFEDTTKAIKTIVSKSKESKLSQAE
jgi:hypothetical protein